MIHEGAAAVDAWLEKIVAMMPPELRRGKRRVTLHIAGADVEFLGIVVQTPRRGGESRRVTG